MKLTFIINIIFMLILQLNALVYYTLPAFADDHSSPQRIVSLAPNTTEILFKLGLEEKLVGVTRYCNYPPAAKDITKVGGFFDPNYEAIVALRPDLTILLSTHKEAQKELEKMKINTLAVPHETIDEIHEAIRRIGAACGAEGRAASLIEDLTQSMKKIKTKVEDKPKPRVLIVIGRDIETGRMANVFVAGQDGFYNKIIEAAGGINAYQNDIVAFPRLSAEGIMELNPDVIVDLVSMIKFQDNDIEEITEQWNQLHVVNAVRKGRVHVIVGNHALRPGPRYILFLQELAALLHPKAFEGNRAND